MDPEKLLPETPEEEKELTWVEFFEVCWILSGFLLVIFLSLGHFLPQARLFFIFPLVGCAVIYFISGLGYFIAITIVERVCRLIFGLVNFLPLIPRLRTLEDYNEIFE